MLWTDGSALPSGVCAASVVGYVNPAPDRSRGPTDRVVVRRRAAPKARCQHDSMRRAYGGSTRSFRSSGEDGGYRAEYWSLGAQSSAFDAELSALVRAVEICALDAEEGRAFRIFTDSQAAMQRI